MSNSESGSEEVVITGTLENWYASSSHEGEFILWGNLFGDIHGRWRNGRRIHTSGIAASLLEEGLLTEGYTVQTRNSNYLLGKPAEVSDRVEPLDDPFLSNVTALGAFI